MASNQERLATCDELIQLLESGKPLSDVRRSLSVMREIRDIYSSIVAKHNAKNAGPAKRKIDSREIWEAMLEDIRR